MATNGWGVLPNCQKQHKKCKKTKNAKKHPSPSTNGAAKDPKNLYNKSWVSYMSMQRWPQLLLSDNHGVERRLRAAMTGKDLIELEALAAEKPSLS